MDKALRGLYRFNRWLHENLGQQLLRVEERELQKLLRHCYGQQVILIGVPEQYSLLLTGPKAHRVLISPISAKHTHLKIEACDLPLATHSIDVVILPHLLEYIEQPDHFMDEIERILAPGGYMVICGFNPISLWGLKRIFTKKDHPPWSGHFYRCDSVRRWLLCRELEIVKQQMILFRPPTARARVYRFLKFIDLLGALCWSPLGGVYILLAQKKTVTMTPYALKWVVKWDKLRTPVRPRGMPNPTRQNNP